MESYERDGSSRGTGMTMSSVESDRNCAWTSLTDDSLLLCCLRWYARSSVTFSGHCSCRSCRVREDNVVKIDDFGLALVVAVNVVAIEVKTP